MSSGLKLLIVGMNWPPETFLARLIKGLADKGVEVTVACSQKIDAEWLSHPNLHWLGTPKWNGSILRRLVLLVKMFLDATMRSPQDIREFAKNIQVTAAVLRPLKLWFNLLPFVGRRWDLIYFPWNSAAIEYLPLFEIGMPVVISCRGSQIRVAPHNPARKSIIDGLRLTFQKALAVHCVSEDIKKEATQYGLDPEKARIIYPAVDSEFFCPLPEQPASSSSCFHIISIGSLSWVKGYEYALLAVRRLVESGLQVCYHIIGDGPEWQRLFYTIADLELQGQVHLHGKLSPLEVRNQLQNADAFLLSSLSEGISNAAMEAMACGIPVVTSDCGGMAEAVTDGVEGLIMPSREPQAMAGALARLAGDRELRRRMGRNGRKRIMQQFSIGEQTEKFIQLCRQVLDNRGGKDAKGVFQPRPSG